jgi:hypothetical protein
MANPSKQKGTAGETELKRILEIEGLVFNRMPASADYDLTNAVPGRLELQPLEVLATRPNRGRWLMSMRVPDFAHLLKLTGELPWETHIEVKRFARFSHHTIFEGKFGS